MSDVSRDTMLLTTPFHSRVEAMCDLNDWGNWMGYTTPNAYFDVELEYFAVRSTTGVFDLSPMNKYRVTGPDAQRYLDRLITRDVSKIGKISNFLQKFANFWRARSRLYQNEILQENMRSTAFFKLYKICILLHRCNLKIFAKNRFEKTAIFVKFQQKNCKCRKICKILSNFKNFSLRIW